MAAVAAQYLPILLFLGVALALSSIFVIAPIIASKFTGADQPYAEKLTEEPASVANENALVLTRARIAWVDGLLQPS